METRLKFEYDETGDTLFIRSVPPYPEQETEQVEYNLFVRRNPRTRAVEAVEVLFFTRWLFREGATRAANLVELFSRPAAAA